jgi:hypothetical protein
MDLALVAMRRPLARALSGGERKLWPKQIPTFEPEAGEASQLFAKRSSIKAGFFKMSWIYLCDYPNIFRYEKNFGAL